MRGPRWVRALSLLVLLGAGAAALAAETELLAGRDFRPVTPPLAVEARDKIEVTEFFWYGCPHCDDFEPVLAAWLKTLPADVAFRRVPAIPSNNKWLPGARLYYSLRALRLEDRLHGKVFDAIHRERLRLDDEKILFDWLAREGVDVARFAEVWHSPAVAAQVQRARELSAASGMNGVPALFVNGRYQALANGNYADLIRLLDRLIVQARADVRAEARAGADRK